MLKILLSVFLFLICGQAQAQEPAALDAHAAYEKGEFAQAAKLYMQAAGREPDNAALHHNLGLALAKDAQLGAAVAAYLRAVQLEPNNPDFRYNLEFLLKQTSDHLAYEPSGFSLTKLTRDLGERWLFYPTVFLLLGGLTLILWNNLRTARSALLWWGSAALLLCGAAGAGLFMLKERTSKDPAAISEAEAKVYAAPSEEQVLMELHEGSPVQILEVKDAWVRIELSDQRSGWIRREALAAFGQHYQFPPLPRDRAS